MKEGQAGGGDRQGRFKGREKGVAARQSKGEEQTEARHVSGFETQEKGEDENQGVGAGRVRRKDIDKRSREAKGRRRGRATSISRV